MVSVNYAFREISCKIVYYGPGLSGKTTNLQFVHKRTNPDSRGQLISLATDTDRTLYFDFLPMNLGKIRGFATKFQLYTVPGQVYYNATRRLVLRGVDGVVFVADSHPSKMAENKESFANLRENLATYGYDLDEIPLILQYNKRDLPDAISLEQLHAALNYRNVPEIEAVASEGVGVLQTLKLVGKMVLERTAGKTLKGCAIPASPEGGIGEPQKHKIRAPQIEMGSQNCKDERVHTPSQTHTDPPPLVGERHAVKWTDPHSPRFEMSSQKPPGERISAHKKALPESNQPSRRRFSLLRWLRRKR